MSMIEQVARAIENAELGYKIELVRLVDGVSTYTLECNDGSPTREFSGHEEAYEHLRSRRSIARARAAIAAMREPTEAMVKATDVVCAGGVYLCAIQDAELAWEAMIDAALAETS